ncbi:MAG: AMP-dependent synthetase/ligase [Mycobacteriales bacterium]
MSSTLREFTAPTSVTVDDAANLSDEVVAKAARTPDRVCFRRRVAGAWQPVTAAAFAAEVTGIAKGLLASGYAPGDRIALMSATRYEWTLVEYAAWAAGLIVVPVYETSSDAQLAWIVGDSGAAALVAETVDMGKRADALRPELAALKDIWTLDEGAIDTLVRAGEALPDAELDRRRTAVHADEIATIIYTSGTTGRPKGCVLTHRNLLFEVAAALQLEAEVLSDGASTLLFLPLAHVLGLVIQCAVFTGGGVLGHLADRTELVDDLRAFEPTFICTAPRLLEKVLSVSRQRAHTSGAAKATIFDVAERTAVAYSRALDAGTPSRRLAASRALFDRLVFGKLRAAIGGRCRYVICGSAPLADHVAHFFRGLGVVVLEGYGLTECTAAASINAPDAVHFGTVGRPVPGVSARIEDDGELSLRGGIVFSRYWHDDAATAETLVDGWLRTGDLAELTDDGFIRIVGRKKELIVTAGGKNVAPSVLEDRITPHPLISQCLVVGDRRPFVAGLITLDPDAVAGWLSEKKRPAAAVDELVDDREVLAEVQAAVDEANASVSRAESVRKFAILAHEFTEAADEVTPSLKLKRRVVLERYADEIDALYD